MSDVTRHYDTLLAQHYSWMTGVPFDIKVAEQRTLLEVLGMAGRSGVALDLGCGPGYQSAALAQLGFYAQGEPACGTIARNCDLSVNRAARRDRK
jgi:hypothetical protein